MKIERWKIDVFNFLALPLSFFLAAFVIRTNWMLGIAYIYLIAFLIYRAMRIWETLK